MFEPFVVRAADSASSMVDEPIADSEVWGQWSRGTRGNLSFEKYSARLVDQTDQSSEVVRQSGNEATRAKNNLN